MKSLFPEIPTIESEILTLKRVTQEDAEGLQELVDSPAVNRYLPTFLFEHKYPDIHDVIDRLYDECLEESLILGVYKDDRFCGLSELYGYKPEIHKISVGCRLLEWCWGQGVCTEVLRMLVDYLYTQTSIEIITVSTMIQNKGSASAARKNGFDLVVHAALEDWGFPEPTLADKWIR